MKTKQTIQKKILLSFFIAVLLATKIFSQSNNFNCHIKNIHQTSSNILEFDIFIERVGVGSPRLIFFQAGIDFNFPGISNGGIISGVFIAGSADPSLPGIQLFPNWNINQTSKQIRMFAASAYPTYLATIIPPSPGIRLGTFRMTNTVPFTSSSTPDFVWSFLTGTSNTTKTVISLDENNVCPNPTFSLTNQHFVIGNPVLNPLCPTVSVVTPNSSCGDIQLNGIITNGTSGTWSTSGTGSFEPNATTLNPTYHPSPLDLVSGVTLTLTATIVQGCNSAISSVTVSFTSTNDNDVCTIDACDPSNGNITHTPVNVDDNNACTTDDCNPVTGVFHIPIYTEDGDACTNDNCDPSTGVITHTPVNIGDGNACTMDNCDPATGSITHTPVYIDDGNACTIDDCNFLTGEITHIRIDDDNNPCTIDNCDPLTGVITNTYNCAPPTITCPPDIFICFNFPDADVVLGEPVTTSTNGIGTLGNNAPPAFPLGTTEVTWTVLDTLGNSSTCIQKVVRNAKVITTVLFTTIPAAQSNVIHVCLGQPIYFLNHSTGINSQQWDFGDGFLSTEISPEHSYNLPGSFLVTLKTFNDCNISESTTITVQVDPETGPDIYCPSVVCAHDTVVYSTSAVCSNYIWSVTGGTIISSPVNSNSIMIVWGDGSNGDGLLTLNIPGCGNFCNRPSQRLIPIIPSTLPVSGQTIVCSGNISKYSVPCLPGTNYFWDAGSSGSVIAGQNTHEATIYWFPGFTGSAIVHVNYQNTLTSCSGIGALNVLVLPILGITGPAKLCPDIINTSSPFNSINTSTLAGANTNWTVITPANVTLTNLQTNSPVFNNYNWNAGPGIYTVIATLQPGTFCNVTVQTTVVVVDQLIPPGPINGTLIVCPNSTHVYTVTPTVSNVNYVWTITGGTPSTTNGTSISITWGSSEPYLISVKQQLTDSPYCLSDATTLSVTQYPPLTLPTVTGSAIVCRKNISTYSFPVEELRSDAIYTWSVNSPNAGNIISINGTNSITIDWTGTGNTSENADVVLTVSLCGEHVVNYPVNINALPVAAISAPTLLCVNVSAQFISSNGISWLWDFGDNSSSTLQNPNHTYSQVGTYLVKLVITGVGGCKDSSTTFVEVNPVPVVPVISGPLSVCGVSTSNYLFSEAMTAGATYSWSVSPPAAGNITTSNNGNQITVQWGATNSVILANVSVHVVSACLDIIVNYPVTVYPVPVADITAPSLVCQNTTATFTAGTTGITSWSWNFGDGGTSSSPTETHTYTTSGIYIVTLVVTGIGNCSSTTNTTVDVNPLPSVPVITGLPSVCAGNTSTYLFNEPMPEGANYTWSITPSDAGNINTANNGSEVSIEWNATNTSIHANVSVHVVSACLDIIVNYDVTINPVPEAAITAPSLVCQNTTATFTAGTTGITSWAWDFGDGGTSSSSTETHTYTTSGIFNVTLVVTGIGNCSSTTNTVVDVYPLPLVPVISGPPSVCAGISSTYLFNEPMTEGANYTWSITPSDAGNINTANNGSQVTIEWGSTNTIIHSNVSVHVVSACLDVIVNYDVTINPIPVATITAPSLVCQNTTATFTAGTTGVTSWSWNFGDGGSSSSSSADHIYTLTGTYTVILTVTGSGGCSNTSTTTITVNPNPDVPVINGTTSVCAGSTGTYSFAEAMTTGATYTWSISPANAGEITSPVNGNNISVHWGITGNISNANVSVHVTNICMDATINFPVTIHQIPVVSITPPNFICQKTAVTFNGSAGVSWLWNFGDTTSSVLQDPPHTYNYAGTKTVKLTVTDNYGCSASASSLINVKPTPVAYIWTDDDLIYCDDEPISVTFHAFNGPLYQFSWQPGSFSNSGPPFTVTLPGNYSVIVTNPYGCSATSDIISVSTHNCDPTCPCGGTYPDCVPCPDVCPCGGTFPDCLPCPNVCPCGGIYPDCLPCPCVSQCIKEPYTFDFSYVNNCAEVLFTPNISGNISNVSWNFGDGSSSNLSSPTHTYSLPGIYKVSLSGTVAGTNSCTGLPCLSTVSVTHTDIIPIAGNFFPEFNCSPSGNIETQLTDLSIFLDNNVIDSWKWYFDGNVNPYAITQNTAFEFTPGIHTVTLVVSSSITGATCTVTKTITSPLPAAANFNSTSPACYGTAVVFSDISTGQVISWAWDFYNNNSSTSIIQNPSYFFNTAGNYSSKLTITDIYGCSNSITKNVVILPNATPTISADNSASFCFGGSVLLTASAGTSYLWSNNETSQAISVTQSGNYSVKVVNPNLCSSTSSPFAVTVYPIHVASFSAPSFGCEGSQVNFNGSGGGTYAWNFGDPSSGSNTSTSSNPSHQFTVGTYTVMLTVSSGPCSNSTSKTIVVNSVPQNQVISASGPLTFCSGGSVTLTAPSADSWKWSTNSTSQSIMVTQSGNYSVSMLTIGGCPFSAPAVNVTVNQTPGASFSAPSFSCEGSQTNFFGSGGGTYAWDFGDPSSGSNTSTSSNPSHQFTVGTYTVMLTVSSGPCSNSTSKTIVVNSVPQNQVISASGPLTFCSGGSVTLTAPTADSWKWSTNSTSQSIMITQSGNYSVSMLTFGGCPFSAPAVTVTVNPTPVASMSAPVSSCEGVPVNFNASGGGMYAWDFGDPSSGSNTSTSSNPSHQFFSPGTYIVSLSVTLGPCSNSTSKTIVINPVPQNQVISVSGPLIFCSGGSVTLTAPSADSWKWSTNSTAQSIMVTQSGNYSVSMLTLAGCPFSAPAVNVKVNPTPVALLNAPALSCQGEAVNFSGSGGGTYSWNFGDPSSAGNTSTSSNPSHQFTSAGSYIVSPTVTLGPCSNSTSKTIIVNPVPQNPVISASGPLTFCAGGSVTLTAPSAASWNWSTNATTQSITVTQSGSYSVSMLTLAGCPFYTPSVDILVNPLPPAIIEGQKVYCAGETIELISAPGYSYTWNFDNLPIDNSYSNVGVDNSILQIENSTTSMTGNYLVHVTDLNTGCSSTSVNYPIVVNPSPLTPVISANAAQPLCEGQQFILTITNPEQNAVYNWNTGQTGISIPAASEGEYFASTVNQFGCKAISEKAVIHPSPDLSCIPSGCFQLCDSILPYTVTGPGGFSNYQWQVLNGSVFETVTTTKDLVVLTNGLYRLVVTNSFGCTATSETLELNFIQCGYCTMVATISSSANVKCYGGNDGSATVTVSDGNGPFAYSWNSDPVQSTSTATGLKAGTYIVKIADARGCHIEISVTITEPSQTLKAVATPGTILCYGGSTNITVSASGGTSPYSGTGTFTRDAGAYSYTVTDANLCTSIISGLITQPETLIVSSTLGTIACFGGSTNVTVTAIGGILPYSGTGVFAHGAGAYSYTVTDFNNCTAATSGSISQPAALNATSTAGTILCYGGTTNVTVTASGGTLPYTGTGSFSRSAGSYSYTVTDFNHCTAVTTGNISQPAVLNATSTAGTILCYGGTTNVTVSASGGTSPYTGIGSFSRSAGSYSYKVMDANRCSAETSGNIFQPTLIAVTATSGVISCYGGTTTVTVSASGGTPAYTGTGTFTVSAGTYTYKVTDSNGCTSTISKTIVQPAVLSISINKVDVECYNGNNGTATAIVTGGTSPYTYLWNTSPAQTTSTATGLKVGSYTVTVKDSKNCTQSTTVAIVNISCTGFKTYTQGGYGAVPSGNNPGTYVQQKFALAFPSGLTVGCTKTLKLTTAQSVIDFLPSSGTPVALKSNLVNSATYSNTLAGQVVTLKLNLVFDTYDPAFSPSTTSLKSLIIGTKTFAGWTVNQLMNEANNVLGGCSSRYTPAQINEAVTNVNQNYDNGNTNAGYLLCPCVGLPSMPNFNYRIDLIETDVEKHLDFSIYPNPNTGDFTIEFESSGLTVEHIVVYNIYGQKVYSQTIDHPMEGNNSLNINLTGVEVGIYFIQFLRGEVEEKMKKIIIVR